MNILTGNVTIKRIWQLLKKTVTSADLANYSVPIDSKNDSDTKRIPLDELRIALMNSGLFDYRGDYDASVNLYPASGGSGTGGTILKANAWIVSVGGTIDGNAVIPGQILMAKIDNPGQTSANWFISLAGGTASSATSNATSNITSTNLQDDKQQIDTKLLGYTETTSAAGTTAMSVLSTLHQHLHGSTTHTHTLPQVSTLTIGRKFHFFNRSTGIWTLNAYDNAKVMYLAPNCGVILQCINISSEGVASWKILANTEAISFHASDLTTACVAGTNKYYKFAEFACEVYYIWAGLLVAQCTGSTFIIDLNNNGNSMVDTKVSIDASEDTSLTAATQPVLNSTYKFITKGAKLTVDYDQVGSSTAGTGLYVVMEVIRT